MYLTSLAHFALSYPAGGVLAFTNATTSAPKNVLLFCNLVAASSAFVVGSTAGAGNVNASATPSPGSLTLTVPFCIISTTSSNPAVTLVSAVTLSSTCASASTCPFANAIAFVVWLC